MNDDPPPPWRFFGKDLFSTPYDGRIDFFRAYCQRMNQEPGELTPPALPVRKASPQVHTTVQQIRKLIKEYSATAQRVGEPLDSDLLLNLIRALQSESRGEVAPLSRLATQTSTQRFLTQSLYDEILEIPWLALKPSEKSTLLTPADWRLCLELLSRFLSPPLP